MITFLIIEPGNTKENRGICRQMPSASPVRSAVFVLFFFFSLLNFVCDFFGLLKHIPIILRSHSKFPMPQQHCATGESPEELILGGCRLPQQWCKARGISRLLFSLLLTWAASGSGRVNFFCCFPVSYLGLFFLLPMVFYLFPSMIYTAEHPIFLLCWNMESFGDWGGRRKEAQGNWKVFKMVSDSKLFGGSVTFQFSSESLRGWK